MTLQKTESFVPLTTVANAAEKREFRVTVIPQADPGHNFQTLGQVASAAAENNTAAAKKNCEPRLLVQRDGERIVNIRIQCSCGQTMELACVYEEPAKTK
jgi:predicted Zn-dependent protease